MYVETYQGPALAEPTRLEDLNPKYLVLGLDTQDGNPRTVFEVIAPLGDHPVPSEGLLSGLSATVRRWTGPTEYGVLVKNMTTGTQAILLADLTPVVDRITGLLCTFPDHDHAPYNPNPPHDPEQM